MVRGQQQGHRHHAAPARQVHPAGGQVEEPEHRPAGREGQHGQPGDDDQGAAEQTGRADQQGRRRRLLGTTDVERQGQPAEGQHEDQVAPAVEQQDPRLRPQHGDRPFGAVHRVRQDLARARPRHPARRVGQRVAGDGVDHLTGAQVAPGLARAHVDDHAVRPARPTSRGGPGRGRPARPGVRRWPAPRAPAARRPPARPPAATDAPKPCPHLIIPPGTRPRPASTLRSVMRRSSSPVPRPAKPARGDHTQRTLLPGARNAPLTRFPGRPERRHLKLDGRCGAGSLGTEQPDRLGAAGGGQRPRAVVARNERPASRSCPTTQPGSLHSPGSSSMHSAPIGRSSTSDRHQFLGFSRTLSSTLRRPVRPNPPLALRRPRRT